MALVRDLSSAQLAFKVAGGTDDQFSVIRFRGSEGLCQLYRFEIELTSTIESIDFATIIGKAAVLSINSASGARWFHGIVSRMEYTGEVTGPGGQATRNHLRAELVPDFWLLTHRYNSRIFQNKTTQEIITDVLAKGGIPADHVTFVLKSSYDPREYCVQYRETDFNFVCRLMEEEGMWWTFEQTIENHKILIADSVDGYKPLEGESPRLSYRPPSGLNVQEEHVYRFRISQCVRPGAVVVNDFNFEKPGLGLEAKADAGRDPGLEYSDYPGEYREQARGTQIAKLRAEEFESGRILAIGQSNSGRLAPSRVFELGDHPSPGLNAKYVVSCVRHQGKQAVASTVGGANGVTSLLDARMRQALVAAQRDDNTATRELAQALLQIAGRFNGDGGSVNRSLTQWLYHAGQVTRDLASVAAATGANPMAALALPNLVHDIVHSSLIDYDAPPYECRFEALPAAVAYRPPRVTPWPVMRGTQTARVVGPGGEEIHTDQYGRVKVKFNWDREGKFDENASCWIRVSQGMAGGGYGMMFLPRVGQEVVVDFLEGDPDQPLIVGRVYNADQMPPYKLPDEKTKSVIKTNTSKGGGGTNEIRFDDLKDKEQILIFAQKDLHVRVTNDRVENVDHNRSLTVKENDYELIKKARNTEVTLDLNEKVGGNKSMNVAGDRGDEVGGSQSIKTGKKFYVNAGDEMVLESASGVTIKCGGNFIKIDSSGVTILGTKVKVNSGGSAGAGTPVTLTAPEAPIDADTVTPGKDVTYSGSGQLVEAAAIADVEGFEFKPPEVEEKKTSWVEIELVDEEGQPWPNEYYEVTLPDGKVIKGFLNSKGQAHVALPEKEQTQVSFPYLDKRAWNRAGEDGQGASDSAEGGAAGAPPGSAPPGERPAGSTDRNDDSETRHVE